MTAVRISFALSSACLKYLLLLCTVVTTTIGLLLLSLQNNLKDCSLRGFLIDDIVRNGTMDRHDGASLRSAKVLSSLKQQQQQQQQQHSGASPTTPTFPIMDIISIGSNTRPSTVQQETFARHLAVRHYWQFTEDDDYSDPLCHSHLSRDDLSAIAAKCHDSNQSTSTTTTSYSGPAHDLAQHFASSKFLRQHPTGWLCAQKRPIDALARVVMTQYITSRSSQQLPPPTPSSSRPRRRHHQPLPDYLWILDDDTWVHVDNVLALLPPITLHAPETARVVAGCLIRSQYDLHLSWYWGGFGVYLTKGAIERLMIPIQCHDDKKNNAQEKTTAVSDVFVQHACKQLDQNWIGERAFFRQGMTLVELMQAYSAQQSYLQHDKWEEAGYCMHSDTTLAYWFNFYHVADSPTTLVDGDSSRPEWMTLPRDDGTNPVVHQKNQHYSLSRKATPTLEQVPHYDRLRAYNDTALHKPRKWHGKIYRSSGECCHRTVENCTLEAHLCHYIPNDHMRNLFVPIYQANPENYLSKTKPLSIL